VKRSSKMALAVSGLSFSLLMAFQNCAQPPQASQVPVNDRVKKINVEDELGSRATAEELMKAFERCSSFQGIAYENCTLRALEDKVARALENSQESARCNSKIEKVVCFASNPVCDQRSGYIGREAQALASCLPELSKKGLQSSYLSQMKQHNLAKYLNLINQNCLIEEKGCMVVPKCRTVCDS